MLGVRPYDPTRPRQRHDVTAAAGTDPVGPGGGGLSVFSDPAAVAVRAAGLVLCTVDPADLPPALRDVPAGDPHRLIEPATTMTLDEFQAALGRTRDLWAIV